MNTIIKMALSATVILSMSATVASADVAKGQKLFQKKLKDPCKMTGAAMAGKHTQGDWEDIYEDGKLADEIKKICPAVRPSDIKENYLDDYYLFFKEYGSDSGNVPSC